MWMFVHLTYLVLSSETLLNEIFCCPLFLIQTKSCWMCAFHNKYGSFLIKNHRVVYVPSTPAKWISFHNQKNRKVVGGKHNFLVHYLDICAPDPSGVVLCNPLYEIAWVQNIYISLLLYIPPGKLEHRIYSLSSLGHISCELEASSSQPTITLDVIAVYPYFPKLLIYKNQSRTTRT